MKLTFATAAMSEVALEISNWITTIWQGWKDGATVLDPHSIDFRMNSPCAHTHVNMLECVFCPHMSVCILCVQLRASLRTFWRHVQGQARWVFMHSRGARKLKEFRSVNARAVVASRGIATLKLKLLITLVNQQSLLKYMTISLFNYIQFHCHSSSLQSTVRWKSEIRTRSTAFRMLHWPVCLQWRKKNLFEYKAVYETEMLSLLFGSQNERDELFDEI